MKLNISYRTDNQEGTFINFTTMQYLKRFIQLPMYNKK